MIAVDTNILVYAHMPENEFHLRSREVVADLLESGERVGIVWASVHEFLSTTSNRHVYPSPSSPGRALEAMRSIIDLPQVSMLGETRDHLALLDGLMGHGPVRGPKVHDARIAAICIGHGVSELWTADRDFSFFPALTTRNPLVE